MKRLGAISLLFFQAEILFAQDSNSPREFRVWAASCAHVPADIRRGRESLAKVIRQSEGREGDAPAFDWDIMIDAGDLSAHQTPPGDRDGMELLRQTERPEQKYSLAFVAYLAKHHWLP